MSDGTRRIEHTPVAPQRILWDLTQALTAHGRTPDGAARGAKP